MKVTRVVAFDPGYERLGVAVIERAHGRDTLVYSDCIRTDKNLPFPERLRLLGEATEKILKKFKPDAAALENVYFEKNAKTALLVSQVRGMLCYIAAAKGLTVWEYTPLEVKMAVTGYGRSDKRAIAALVPRLIALPPQKRLDDEMDAIAVGLTCLAATRGL